MSTTGKSASAAATNKNYRNAAAANAAAEVQAAVQQAQTEALIVVLNRVDELVTHLSSTIKKSVLNLPNSLVSFISNIECFV